MFFDTRNKDMYGLEVGISKGFPDIRALPVSGGTGLPHMVMTYIPSDVY
jgi:hypothetical protein